MVFSNSVTALEPLAQDFEGLTWRICEPSVACRSSKDKGLALLLQLAEMKHEMFKEVLRHGYLT